MDVVGEVAVALRVTPERARALVGGVLALVGEELSDRRGFEAARAFAAELPELETWRVEALRQIGHAGRATHGTPRLRAALEAVFDEHRVDGSPAPEGAAVNGMLDVVAPNLRADAMDPRAHARIALALMVRFLRIRLSPTLFSQVLGSSALMRGVAQRNGEYRGIQAAEDR